MEREILPRVEAEVDGDLLPAHGGDLFEGRARGVRGVVARVHHHAGRERLDDDVSLGGGAPAAASAAILGRVGGGDRLGLQVILRVEEGAALGGVGREEEAGDAERVADWSRRVDGEDVAAARGVEREAGDGRGGAHQLGLDLIEAGELGVLEGEVRAGRGEVVLVGDDAVDEERGVGVAAGLALPEAAALEGHPAEVFAAGEVDAKAAGVEAEAAAEERRRERGAAEEELLGLAEHAEAALGRVERGLEDAGALRHDREAFLAEVEGEGEGGGDGGALLDREPVDEEVAGAAVVEADARDLGDVDRRLHVAAVGQVLFAAPEAAREVELDHLIAGEGAEAALEARGELGVVVLDLQAELHGAVERVVDVEAEHGERAPVGDAQVGEACLDPRADHQRARAVGVPRGGDLGRAAGVAGPLLDRGDASEVLHHRGEGAGRGALRAAAIAPGGGDDHREDDGAAGRTGGHVRRP